MEEINIEIIRSERKTVSLEIRPDLSVIVRAPLRMKNDDIKKFIKEKSEWLKKHYDGIKKRNEQREANVLKPFSENEIREMTALAKSVIPQKAAMYARRIGVTFGKITIRHQVSRWGSCSSKKNLSFNCLLMQCPEAVIDYVVVHELCHLKEMNHSQYFWAEVENILPEYEIQKKWLKENGAYIIDRLKR